MAHGPDSERRRKRGRQVTGCRLLATLPTVATASSRISSLTTHTTTHSTHHKHDGDGLRGAHVPRNLSRKRNHQNVPKTSPGLALVTRRADGDKLLLRSSGNLDRWRLPRRSCIFALFWTPSMSKSEELATLSKVLSATCARDYSDFPTLMLPPSPAADCIGHCNPRTTISAFRVDCRVHALCMHCACIVRDNQTPACRRWCWYSYNYSIVMGRPPASTIRICLLALFMTQSRFLKRMPPSWTPWRAATTV